MYCESNTDRYLCCILILAHKTASKENELLRVEIAPHGELILNLNFYNAVT